MRAVVLREPRKIEMMDVPKPSPREDEVIIKVGAVGICGSDVRYFLGENPRALHTLGKDVKEEQSFILEHKVVGKITEVGKWTEETKLEGETLWNLSKNSSNQRKRRSSDGKERNGESMEGIDSGTAPKKDPVLTLPTTAPSNLRKRKTAWS